ncbi:MAG TPA: protein-L-isoaspartate(D-aspartate) O-methyltransferase [Alphaproteobacteria bacterium]
MVTRQLAGRGIIEPRVLSAMRRVPRELFVPDRLREFAYDDTPLPIGEGQTISQPYIVALMLEAAMISPGDRVLEIGTGLGYAAAAASHLAAAVYTVERIKTLADSARARLAAAGVDNVHVMHGDGTRGWPEFAPFDAIIVAAASPEVPRSLRDQLRVGGRLIIPTGEGPHLQRLKRITRRGTHDYEEEDLGSVAFVPLVGTEGWPPDDTGQHNRGWGVWRRSRGGAAHTERSDNAIELIKRHAEPLPQLESESFGEAFDRFGTYRMVLLGESTHGTSEFYRARARLTRHLVEHHGFNIVAIEADWPDAALVDALIRDRPRRLTDERPFTRFPVWMWRNTDFSELVRWARSYNENVTDDARKVSLHGLDLYSLYASTDAVIKYLDKVDPEAARIARERYGCLTPWQSDPATYGRAALNTGYALCEAGAMEILRDLLAKRIEYIGRDSDAYFDAAQNARLVAAAERYYRIMYYGSAESWNLRDKHMFETLQAILAARGPSAKAVVWAHNSHIGNAAATQMGAHGELNIGQLCRAEFGPEAALIGFSTDRGNVAAASDWGGPMEVKQVRPSRPDSYEYLCRESVDAPFLLDLRPDGRRDLLRTLFRNRLERAIGVIYRPETERMSHYFDAVLPRQFDAWVWFPETRAVTPLPVPQTEGTRDTYPFGL